MLSTYRQSITNLFRPLRRFFVLPEPGPFTCSVLFLLSVVCMVVFSLFYLAEWKTSFLPTFFALFILGGVLVSSQILLLARVYGTTRAKLAIYQVLLLFGIPLEILVLLMPSWFSLFVSVLLVLTFLASHFLLKIDNRTPISRIPSGSKVSAGILAALFFIFFFPFFQILFDHTLLATVFCGDDGKLKANGAYQINTDGHRGNRIDLGDENLGPRLLFLGDSSTFGYGVKSKNTFASQTERILRQRGYPGAVSLNAGVVGATLPVLQTRYRLYKSKEPSVVFIMAGHHYRDMKVQHPVNFRLPGVLMLTEIFIHWDRMRGINEPPRSQWTELLSGLAEEVIRDGHTPVFLVYPTPKLDPDVIRFQKELALEKNIAVIDLYSMMMPKIDQLLLDPVHPNRLGHRQIGGAIADWMATSGLVPPSETKRIAIAALPVL
jgi:lysophospholipase L1-like esterase